MAFLNKRVRTSKSEKNVNNSDRRKSNAFADETKMLINIEVQKCAFPRRNSQHFDKNNVRVLLFKDSGSNGRRLIFDSSVIKSVSHDALGDAATSSININQLTDMVFGALSLRCHETYFRIHDLSSSNRIMFTQVFPFPGSKKIRFSSFHPYLQSALSNVDVVYLRAAACDTNLEDSSLSLESGMTGMQLGSQVFHSSQYNTPNSSTSTIDSGYAEQSFYSFATSNRSSFNSGLSLNRDQNKISIMENRTYLTDPVIYSTKSIEDYCTRTSNTLGLVIILAITADKDEYTKYYLKYIAFIESVVFRIRRNIEFAFTRPGILLSLMMEVSNESTQWLIRMFPCLQETHTDEMNKVKLNKCNRIKKSKFSLLSDAIFPKKYALNYKTAKSRSNESDNYFDEFCELLEKMENKETNFFISTMITATLTYHLGWITTCFPYISTEKELVFQTETSTYNSLWRQMTELYGAHGCPTKSAQTIISGSNQNEIISKILHFIRYFVRYTKVIHNSLERINVNKDNTNADIICLNYKYTGNFVKESSPEQKLFPTAEIKSTLKKSKACSSNLSELSKIEYDEINLPQEEKVTFLLGENEELVNIKPYLTSGCKSKITLDTNFNETTDLDSPNKLNDNITHSNSCSVVDDLFDVITEQEHTSRYLGIINNKHSQSEFPNTKQETYDLEINNRKSNRQYELRFNKNKEIFMSTTSPLWNFYGPERKHGQLLCINNNERTFHKITKMKIFSFPLPRSKLCETFKASYASTLESNVVGNYVPDMVIQGTSTPKKEWILKLKRDLYLTRQIYFFDGNVDEAVAIVGNTDTWDVEIISSRVSINQSTMGTKLDVSSLIANMLEVLLEMCNLHFCKKYSATHIEQRLLEICIRSCAFSQLLMHTDMCTMDLLTTTLHLEINDIPLLMSVASIISPQVTKKYGLSFQ